MVRNNQVTIKERACRKLKPAETLYSGASFISLDWDAAIQEKCYYDVIYIITIIDVSFPFLSLLKLKINLLRHRMVILFHL